ncbi:transmembrane protein 79 isoform X1 [Perca flavescens]|nr:transmembrane protein 79-like isoform X1 [Perca flavescens]XP_028428436.1 transmembrane protein 79-like isoform X1 [Perca flavescens]XP_028428437.1 transmembrane protein 79-like isoform X2 [Perca flavescens]XP_028428438.1 transmembrane protein 79-like isoform X1 [Perca flavescens]
MSLLTDSQCLTGSTRMEDSGGVKVNQMDGEDEWEETGDRQTGGQTGKGDRLSVRSAASWTESQLEGAGLRTPLEAEPESQREGAGLRTPLGAGLRTALEAEPAENELPEHAAQVFSPSVAVLHCPNSPRDTEAFWEMESEKRPFLGPRGEPQDYNQHGCHYEDMPPARCGPGCLSRDVLKGGVSLMTSLLLFPLLVWGGFLFLPFDAPLMDGAALRLVYVLRCSVFASIPIALGWLVLGASRLRSSGVGPRFDDELKEAEPQEVSVHRRFVSDSASLFLIYFLQLVVMAMYLSQHQLKLVPLLTMVFAFGRLVYWVAAACGSSVRAFGFGLSFLPSLAMMAANIYFLFTVEAEGSIFSLVPGGDALTPPPARQRFWG